MSSVETNVEKEEERDGILSFVASKSPSLLFKMAKRAAKTAGICTTTLVRRAVISDQQDRKTMVFVCDDIPSEVSHHLIDMKCKVIGPSVVCWCLKNQQPLPTGCLVRSMTMNGVHVSCSSLQQAEREKLYDQVKLMGGEVSKNLTSDVTHLVAGAVGSKKYRTAVGLGIPIMSQNWIMKCWEESKTRIISASDDQFSSMKCPAFLGCCICVTGIENRQNVKRIIEENGGTYSAWLFECIKQGLCLDEQLYPVSTNRTQSIAGASDGEGNDKQDEGKCNKEDRYHYDISDHGKQTTLIKSKFQHLDLEMDVSNLYLDGCRIAIRSSEKLKSDILLQIVNSGGGTRCHSISDSITHFVTDEVIESDCRLFEAMSSPPYIVSQEWLLACCESKQKVLEEGFMLSNKLKLIGMVSEPEELQSCVSDVSPDCITNGIEKYGSNGRDTDDIMEGYQQSGISSISIEEISCSANCPLKGKSFAIADVVTCQSDELVKQIVSHGGVMTEATLADILIVSIDSSISCFHSNQQLFTPLWLSRCIETGQHLDTSLHPLYQPIPIRADFNPFAGVVFCISQFVDLERDVLMQFIQLLGGTVQQQMLRKDKDNLKATNYLVLKEASGPKYEASKLWNVPAVSSQWIYECAQQKSLTNVEPFIIHEKVNSIPVASNVQEQRHTRKFQAGGRKSLGTALSSLSSNIRPQFDTADALQGLNSFTSGSGHGFYSADESILSSAYQSNVQTAISQIGHPVDSAGANSVYHTTATSSTVLSGVVLFVTKKLAKQQADLHDIAAALGSDYRFTYDESCTHVIHEGRLQSGGKEIRLAKENNKFIVSPHWLFACREGAKHLNEAAFPHTYNPRRSLTGICKKRDQLSWKVDDGYSNSSGKTNQLVETSYLSESVSLNSLVKPLNVESTRPDIDSLQGPSSEDREDFKRQIDELVSAAKNRRTSSRRKSHQNLSTSKTDRQHICGNKTIYSSSCKLGDTSWRESMSMATISYDDPSGREERERIIAQMEETVEVKTNEEIICQPENGNPSCYQRNQKRCLPASQKVALITSSDCTLGDVRKSQVLNSKENRLTPTPPAPPPIAVPIRPPGKTCSPLNCSLLLSQVASTSRTPVFQLSGLDRDEKMDYSALIETLGGKFYDYDYYVTSASHLVAGKASRTEKFMAMVAAGKWVLHKSYLEASRQAGKFVKEEQHEWGKEVSGKEKPTELAKAAKRWRVKINTEKSDDQMSGAFRGWRVLLAVDGPRKAGFQRLLEAGGATIVSSRPPFCDVHSATHAFINMKGQSLLLVDIAKLKSAGVLCLTPDYIGEYLVQPDSPDPSSFCAVMSQKLTTNKRQHTEGTAPGQVKKARLS
ncbi:DNA topoisomerase 2-binding protein 1-like isoform X2 [Corticium candelabrum]|uniref:DNA topoisomerase 2-binding protein 1-like isoform X2 n=1 Tax=Corticium candelabrum TaxID=121492 RepID=UPI002E2602B6|nr:DNA topoisomerase 2-binding protein 1-like isoform X2 [Corticium candelabrum]